MKFVYLVFSFLCVSASAEANLLPLIFTPDGMGQFLFKQGNYPAAANYFENREWKATAEYRAGKYDSSAVTLQNMLSANNLYNRGNAFAQSNKWQKAVNSYTAALNIDPTLQDAAFNKKLIEQFLKQNPQPSSTPQTKQNTAQQNSVALPVTTIATSTIPENLKQVDDDPGGLLKEKFLRDHENYNTDH